MYEIRALGLLDHDVLSSIEIPHLSKFYSETMTTPVKEHFEGVISIEDADKFDQDLFALSRNVRAPPATRNLIHPQGVGRSSPPRTGQFAGGTYKNLGPPPSLPLRKVLGLRTQNCRPRVKNDYQVFLRHLLAPLHPALPYTPGFPRSYPEQIDPISRTEEHRSSIRSGFIDLGWSLHRY
jgi:hypothetical protein